MSEPTTDWWRSAVIYEVYLRSFADGNGDGDGDVEGLRTRLPYLRDLGVDAIWITPWYPSPMADGGYDVSDYRDIQPRFGSLSQARLLLAEAHAHNLKVIIDLVPNHTSDRHPWFQEALASEPGSAARNRYVFRPGRGPDGSAPPNDWRSVFGGPAWSRGPDDVAGQWYLHLFAPQQPDLNWENPEVHAEFLDIMRFWLDLGVDGFRIDVAHGLIKQRGLPDLGVDHEDVMEPPDRLNHPHWDREEVHEIYRSWRRMIDAHPADATFVAEAWVANPKQLARYVRPDELHSAFNFDFLRCSWHPARLREVIDSSMAALHAVGAPATWVLSNHDVTRHVTRYGRPHTGARGPRTESTEPVNLELGLRRARAAVLLMLALPGGAYLYQGEELGLWEVEDLPEELLQDPTWERSGHTVRGRDGCRVPIPWSGDTPPFGFGPAATARPWLPQPTAWKDYTVESQSGDPHSMLELYRSALRLRRSHPALGDGTMRWLDAPAEVLLFARDPGFLCAVNLSSEPVKLPGGAEPLLVSAPLDRGRLPGDAAAWLSG
ncbi:MAG TPA: glycoside hydrolase family 13 protein [Actinophytocola sp.]|uniref:glycoside hydrolase family 13 protein n=1 Tax=Actinophytocola sp. TaxID=1872138 RepID=UPI002DDD2CFF|nr:glycoside hydrolase family 13 protein [Actinophytocola sp.]HEV2779987.1 glycoside hydrolase family 13 protein [Actinophytocola sp.]